MDPPPPCVLPGKRSLPHMIWIDSPRTMNLPNLAFVGYRNHSFHAVNQPCPTVRGLTLRGAQKEAHLPADRTRPGSGCPNETHPRCCSPGMPPWLVRRSSFGSFAMVVYECISARLTWLIVSASISRQHSVPPGSLPAAPPASPKQILLVRWIHLLRSRLRLSSGRGVGFARVRC